MSRVLQSDIDSARFSLEKLIALEERVRRGEVSDELLDEFKSHDLEGAREGQRWAVEHAPHVGEAARLCIDYGARVPTIVGLALAARERIPWFREALAYALKLGPPQDAVVILLGLAAAHGDASEPRRAIRFAREALTMARGVQSAFQEGLALAMLGDQCSRRRQYRRACRLHAAHAYCALRSGDERGYAEALDGMAGALADVDRLEEAQLLYEEALSLACAQENRSLAGRVLNNLGLVLKRRNKIHDAMERYRDQLALARTQRDNIALAKQMLNLASAYLALDELQDALERAAEALDLYTKAADHRGAALAHQTMGLAHLRRGDIERAQACFESSERIASTLDDPAIQHRLLGHLARIDLGLGQPSRAAERLRRSIKIDRQIGTKSDEGIDTFYLARALEDQGDHEGALSELLRALTLLRDAGNRSAESTTLGKIGMKYAERGEHGRALDYYREALALHREAGQHFKVAYLLGEIAMSVAACGDHVEAIIHGEQAIALYEDLADPDDAPTVAVLRERVSDWRSRG